ncbi:MAG: HpcH/HpaI aldolase/citrate lyase family protein [Acidiferrobacterales bacterium]
MELLRTFLFAPGNHPRKVEKAFTLGADAVILDLEDAVALDEKVAARKPIVEALKKPRSCKGYVRVNAANTPFCYGDLLAIVGDWLDGIVLPMVEDAAELLTIDWLLTQLERERGLSEDGIDLMPIVETGMGVADVRAIADAGSRVRRLSFGAGDYTRDMGMNWTLEEGELTHARSEIVLASRIAGLEPPIDTVFIHIGKHLDALKRTTQLARDLGFQGKLCIHPEQVGPINEVFTPTEKEIARAKKIVDAFDAAEAGGSASIQVDGYFVDYPIVERARRLLAIAEKAGTKGKR